VNKRCYCAVLCSLSSAQHANLYTGQSQLCENYQCRRSVNRGNLLLSLLGPIQL